MTEGAPPGARRPGVDWSDLGPRIGSAVVLVAVALSTAWLGGWLYALFWTLAGMIVVFEWLRLVSPADLPLRAGLQGAGVLVAGAMAASGYWLLALGFVAVCTVIASLLASRAARLWDAAGVVYALALVLAAIAIRRSADLGLIAVLWLFAVVWATDVFAYFAGKGIGGPKLWPRVSPKKTWAGSLGGALGGTLAGVLTLTVAGVPVGVPVVVVGLVVAIASEGGDLFESHLKRLFGVKDSGGLIPGHGGVMDRLDAFVVAVVLSVAIGVVRMPHDVARGLLVW